MYIHLNKALDLATTTFAEGRYTCTHLYKGTNSIKATVKKWTIAVQTIRTWGFGSVMPKQRLAMAVLPAGITAIGHKILAAGF